MKRKLLFYLLCLTLFSMIGCSEAFKSGGAAEALPEEPKQPNIALPNITVTEAGNITLSKGDLEKEFLLQASFIDHSSQDVIGTPAFEGKQSRIVYFTQKENGLFMMEANEGQLTSNEFPSERILTSFPIVEEMETTITFDFNAGMEKIFVMWDWYGSDLAWGVSPQYVVDTVHSFIKEARSEEKRILIRQIAQIKETNRFSGETLLPIEVVYYFEPYQENPNFQSKILPNFDRVGFFEVNPHVRPEYGIPESYITRWDIRKPIVFHLSDNTPPEYVDAVKEGILYWNKAFGGPIVQVEMAPPGVRAPNPDYNIVQWVTNHHAGSAYADAQMDPRTGEILHAQIFFATVFPMDALDKLKRLETIVEEEEEVNVETVSKGKEHPFKTIGLGGFPSGRLCNYPIVPEEITYDMALDPSAPLKMSQDYVRDVIAHEVGHTLGLRHNFAASQGSELLPHEIHKRFDSYIKTGSLDESKRVASSVMDYLRFRESVLSGQYLKNGSDPLPYDRMAIEWGYYGHAIDKDVLAETLFCTDSHVFWDGFIDCQRWDRSHHPLLGHATDFLYDLESLPETIAYIYLDAKTYFDEKYRYPVEEVGFDSERLARRLTWELQNVILLLEEGDIPSLLIHRNFPKVTDLNEEEYDQAITRWIDEAIAQIGGLGPIATTFTPQTLQQIVSNYSTTFQRILEKPSFKQHFTSKELRTMKKTTDKLFQKIGEKLEPKITEILARSREDEYGEKILPPPYRTINDRDGLETILARWADYIITDGAEKIPTFDGEHRLLATEILQSYQGPTTNWQKKNREETLQKLLKQLEKRYGTSIDRIDPNILSEKERELYEWEMQIINALQTNEDA